MIHYHGTPITPVNVLYTLAGRSFCVSFFDPRDVGRVHGIGELVMLDNGAFSAWKIGAATDWPGYYRWCEKWLVYPTTWAVIPDVIDADDEAANDALVDEWPHGDKGAPVWHMHESIDRLVRLCDEWPRVCIGSSAEYATVGNARWHRRMSEAMNAVCVKGIIPCWLHMLRGMALSGSHYPFASADSTDIARNHNGEEGRAARMAQRWAGAQCDPFWTYEPEQMTI